MKNKQAFSTTVNQEKNANILAYLFGEWGFEQDFSALFGILNDAFVSVRYWQFSMIIRISNCTDSSLPEEMQRTFSRDKSNSELGNITDRIANIPKVLKERAKAWNDSHRN
jgi:hypothetical protein